MIDDGKHAFNVPDGTCGQWSRLCMVQGNFYDGPTIGKQGWSLDTFIFYIFCNFKANY